MNTKIKKIIISIITIIMIGFGFTAPLMSKTLTKTLTSSEKYINLINTTSKYISNNNITMFFDKDNNITSIYDKKTDCDLLLSGEKITILNISKYKYAINDNVIRFYDDNNNYVELEIQGNKLMINSNIAKKLCITTLRDNTNNSVSKGKLIMDRNIESHNIVTRIKDGGTFLGLLGGNSNVNINCKDINEYINSNHNNEPLSINNTNSLINRETMNSVFSVNINNEFGKGINTYCANNHNHLIIESSQCFNDASIAIVPNNPKSLKEYNLLNTRYSTIPFFPEKFSQLIDYCMKLSNNKIYGFLMYVVIISALCTPSFIGEIKSQQDNINKNHEIAMINNDFNLSDVGKEAEIKRVNELYDKKSGNMAIFNLIPPFLSIFNMFYAIPYCNALFKVNFLWMNLGKIDNFNLLSTIGLNIYNLSPLTFILIIIILYKLIMTFMSDNKENITQDIFSLFSAFVITRQFSTANVLLFIWLTYIYKDIVVMVYKKITNKVGN